MKKHNFGAGPCILPQEVFEQAAAGILDYNYSGLSILEISHRSELFTAILEETESLVRELLTVPDDYAVLFLSGGASSQFFMAPMNLLDTDQTAGFLDTGTWSTKAIKEAKNFGQVKVVASSKDKNYTFIPKDYATPQNLKYLHLTSNNTIFGTQIKAFPQTEIPLICDMSSDIFTRPIEWEKFILVYAGAQKNLGPAGITLVVVHKDQLNKVNRNIPSMLNYSNHMAKKSAFNTPPVYAIYVSMLNLRWLKQQGGIRSMEIQSTEKARLIYTELDRNPCFTGTVVDEDRSDINATFVMAPGYEPYESNFLELCEKEGCVGVKGHRSVGGFRASMYNALPVTSAQKLVEIMQNFEKQYT